MESGTILAASRICPRFARRAARRLAAAGIGGYLRTRARLLGAPPTEAGYSPLTLRAADLVDCRVPLSARLGNGMTVEVLWRDYIGSVIQRDGYYEPNIVRLLTSLLKPGAVFFDVGAHIGQYSLVASRLVGPTGQVHAFEPDPDTFRTLSGNCRRNRLNNVRLNQIALSNTEGRALFHFATMADIGSNSLAECDPYNRSGRSAEIECRTIREYCRERGIARIDIMKMDVEGAESAVLSGGDGLFTGPARPVAIIEFEEKRQQAFGSSCAALRAWLLERNYRLFVIGETIRPYVPSAADPRSFNVLALPAERQDVVQG